MALKMRTKPKKSTIARGTSSSEATSNRKPGVNASASHNGGMRREVTALKRELLLDAACEAFYEHGYNLTTVDMITAKLSSTKAVFYYQFKDKHEALAEIYNIALNGAIEHFERALDQGGRAPEILSAMAYNYAQWVVDHQLYVAVFWREERNLSKEMRASAAGKQRRIDDLVGRVLRDGLQSGDFNFDDAQLTSRAITGMITFTYTWWRPDRRLSREDIAKKYVSLALRLAGARKANA